MPNPIQMPTTDLDRFRLAYREWKQITDEYNERLLAMCEGRENPGPDLERLVADLEAKYLRFVVSAKRLARDW